MVKYPVVISILIVALSLSLTGCSTVPDPYIPERIGAFNAKHVPDKQLALHIQLDQPQATLGDVITFKVVIENISKQAIWIPKKPNLLFYWIYPNGLRDNYVVEFPSEVNYRSSDVVLLQPGEQWMVQERIETFYFPKAGITEFQARLQTARNTNKDLHPFWQGAIFSNHFGVLLERPKGRRLLS